MKCVILNCFEEAKKTLFAKVGDFKFISLDFCEKHKQECEKAYFKSKREIVESLVLMEEVNFLEEVKNK
jgi:hypothetical protein